MIGFAIDAIWHGGLHPDFEGAGHQQMVMHLLTVHIVFLIGVAGLLVSTAWGLVDRLMSRGSGDVPWGVAFAGAVIQTVGQVWDAYEHLQMSNGGPVAWTMIVLGPLVTVGALVASGRRHRRDRRLTEAQQR